MKTTDNAQAEKWQTKINSLLALNGRKIDEFGYLSSEQQAELKDALNWKLDELNTQHTRILELMGEVTELPANRIEWEATI